ncbi:MAG: PAS domain-containing sensor histidine kinase [Halodesulfurarchaeum sp.]
MSGEDDDTAPGDADGSNQVPGAESERSQGEREPTTGEFTRGATAEGAKSPDEQFPFPGDDRTAGNPDEAGLFRRLIEYSSDIITVLDADGTIRFTSPSTERVLGYDPEAEVGRNALERVHPADRDAVRAAFDAVLEEPGETKILEYRYRTATGNWAWLESRGQNRLEDPVIRGIVITSRDVTTRLQRERALETLHDRTRELLTADEEREVAELTARAARDALGYPFTVVRLLTPDGGHLEPVAVTEEAEEVLGTRPVYEVGEGTAGRAFEAGEAKLYEEFHDLDDGYDRGSARSGLFVPIGDHGVLAIGETEPDALDEEDIQLARILAANAEVALDRVEHERELTRQNERLGEFASILSHDLRSPLTVASGRLEMVDAPPEQLDPIRGALDRMQELVENVLALARHGETVDSMEAIDLASIAAESWQRVSTRNADLEVETEQSVMADPSRLSQVFENLYANAVEHGGAGVTIRVGGLPDGFFVEDEGPGIPPDHRERVFESGFSTSESGTGFGLAIVKQIAEAHGWEVAVTEGAAGGARFEFTGVTMADSA